MNFRLALTIAKQLLTTEKGQKTLKVIVIAIVAIILLVATIFMPISGFVTGVGNFLEGEDLDDEADIDALLDDNFVITETKYYKSIANARETYINQVTEAMRQRAAEVREENKYEEERTGTDSDGNSYTYTVTVYPTVDVISPNPPIVTVLAYFCTRDETLIADGNRKLSKQSIIDFYNKICNNPPFDVTTYSKDYYTVSAAYKTDDEIAAMLLEEGILEDEGDVDLFKMSIERITELIQESGGMGYEGVPSGNISNSSVAKRIWDYFKGKGWSDYACAGLIGNIEAECSMNVTLQESGGTGIGMCQWSHSRRTRFLNWMSANGYELSNVEAQCEYLLVENVWYRGNITLYNSGGLKHQSKTNSLSQYGSYQYEQLSDAVDDFLWHWECPNYRYAQWDRRQGAAQDAYNLFASGGSSIAHNGTYAQIKASFFPNGALPASSSQMGAYLTTISFVNSAGATKKATVHKAVAADLLSALTKISANGYEIKELDSYVWKNKTNSSSGARSSHSYGLAIDVNYSYGNPQVINGKVMVGTAYGSHELSMKEDGVAVKTMKGIGWKWGGNWTSSKDYMHFSVPGD